MQQSKRHELDQNSVLNFALQAVSQGHKIICVKADAGN